MAFIASSEDVNLEKDSVLTKPHHSVMALQARIDNLDDADFPTRGRRLSAKLSWGDKFFGGDLVYRDFAADGEWVTSPLDKLSLSFALRFASADRRLPLQERFSLGGRRSFMGLADDELLGDHLIAATIKGRYRIYPRSYAEARG
ncbi:MAG: BamA/TamA family outer membrane protein, partial [candidate division Zixibacteria bacterium]|nr:BamA/TamA family outer membrane protein [candidate division Zixibacteria bacterium]